jgi:Sec-independent protein translocase protein TatA
LALPLAIGSCGSSVRGVKENAGTQAYSDSQLARAHHTDKKNSRSIPTNRRKQQANLTFPQNQYAMRK